MALYHFHVTQIKRSEGRSAVASAAYRAGEKLHNLWDGETYDYTKKGGVILAEIMLPEYAPKRFFDRSTLWNEVEQVEKIIMHSLLTVSTWPCKMNFPWRRISNWRKNLFRNILFLMA